MTTHRYRPSYRSKRNSSSNGVPALAASPKAVTQGPRSSGCTNSSQPSPCSCSGTWPEKASHPLLTYSNPPLRFDDQIIIEELSASTSNSPPYSAAKASPEMLGRGDLASPSLIRGPAS